VGLQ